MCIEGGLEQGLNIISFMPYPFYFSKAKQVSLII